MPISLLFMTSSDVKALFNDKLQDGVICNYPSLKQVDELLVLTNDGKVKVLMCNSCKMPKLFIHNPSQVDDLCNLTKTFTISAATMQNLILNHPDTVVLVDTIKRGQTANSVQVSDNDTLSLMDSMRRLFVDNSKDKRCPKWRKFTTVDDYIKILDSWLESTKGEEMEKFRTLYNAISESDNDEAIRLLTDLVNKIQPKVQQGELLRPLMIDYLSKKFQRDSITTTRECWAQLMNLSHDTRRTTQFLNDFDTIVTKCNNSGLVISDSLQATILLHKLNVDEGTRSNVTNLITSITDKNVLERTLFFFY